MSDWFNDSVIFEQSRPQDICALTGNQIETLNDISRLYSDSAEVAFINEFPVEENGTTSAILYYCKQRMLRPYTLIAKLLGWKKLFVMNTRNLLFEIIQLTYVVIAFSVMTVGFLLQFLSCFSREMPRGYYYGTEIDNCRTSAFWLAFLPGSCFVLAYVNMLHSTHSEESGKLQILMEMALIQTSYPENIPKQKKMLLSLKWLFSLGLLLITFALSSSILSTFSFIKFDITPISSEISVSFKWLLAVSCFLQDLVIITVMISYSVQCQLLIMCLTALKERVLLAGIPLPQAAKDLQCISISLERVNNGTSHSVGILLIKLVVEVIHGIIWLNKYVKLLSICDIAMISLISFAWTITISVTLVQASRLSNSGDKACELGNMVANRPFGYESTSQDILDSFLILTHSFRLKAKILMIPIYSWSFSVIILSLLSVMLAYHIFYII